MRSARSALLALTIGMAGLAAGAHGPQATRAEWLRQNDKSNRWEGVGLVFDVGNPPLELVNFVANPGIPSSPSQPLRVTFYKPPQTSVQVYAREREVADYYWMQAKEPAAGWSSGWNTFAPWPAPYPTLLPRSNLGVVVRLDDRFPLDGHVTPAVIESDGPVSERRLGEYEMSFRPGVSVTVSRFSVWAGCPAIARVPLVTEELGRQYSGLPFVIGFDLRHRDSGDITVRVELGADRPGQFRPITHEYCFPHRASLPASR